MKTIRLDDLTDVVTAAIISRATVTAGSRNLTSDMDAWAVSWHPVDDVAMHQNEVVCIDGEVVTMCDEDRGSRIRPKATRVLTDSRSYVSTEPRSYKTVTAAEYEKIPVGFQHHDPHGWDD